MKFYIDCVGCEQRKLDSQRIINYLNANGHDRVESPSAADYSFLVTCGVDKSSEELSLTRLSEMAKEVPQPKNLVISGCLPAISPDKLSGYGNFQTFSPTRLEDLDQYLASHISVPMSEISYPNLSVFDGSSNPKRLLKELTPREEYDLAKMGFKIRVNNGCLMNCSYCVIKIAMGSAVSVPFDDIVDQFQMAVERYEPTIMFVGGDTGAYGFDIGPETRFYSLLEKTLRIPGEYRVFVHDFNVNWYLRDTRSYDDVFSINEKHGRLGGVMLPIQSGSNRILRLMKRPYTSEAVIEKLGKVRKSFSSVRLGTHIITGFPSEDECDFNATMRLLDEVGFDFIDCFVYSENDRAKSASIQTKVDPAVARKRASRIAYRFGDRVKVFG